MKVSIIVPIYNVEKYIRKCIDSLLNQTFPDILIYAISDGSKDRSVEILKEYNDERLLVLEKENGGYGSVLEFAIKKINTKYFLICDPDDWLENDAIEKLYKSAEKQKTDLTIANFNIHYCNGVLKKQQIYSKTHYLESGKKYTELDNFAFALWSPHSKLFVTEFARNIDFPRKVSYTDALLYMVYLSRIKTATYVDEYISNYLIDRPGNTSGELLSYTEKTFNSQLLVYDSIIEQLSYDSKQSDAILCKLLLFLIEMAKNVKTISKTSERKEMNKKLVKRVKGLRPYSIKISNCYNGDPISIQTLKKIYIKFVLIFPFLIIH